MPPNQPSSGDAGTNAEAMAAALHSLGYAILRRTPSGELVPVGEVPGWVECIARIGAQRDEHRDSAGAVVLASDFLRDFVEGTARHVWAAEEAETSVSSGIWTESDTLGKPLHMEAVALSNKGLNLLLIRLLGQEYDRLQHLTQRANVNALQHRKLSVEMQKKDVLLQCIVHDLNNPLSSILLILQNLYLRGDPASQKLAKTALDQARRQRNLIKSVSELFSTDLTSIHSRVPTSESIESLVDVASTVVRDHLNSALQRSVSISLESEVGVDSKVRFRAEAEPFQRIMENLVVNALRYAPPESTVFIRVLCDGTALQFRVQDSGPGVEPDLIDALFDPFTQGTSKRGSMGLGLYFCRITLERWGGSITYDQEDPAVGSTTFVVTLNRGESAHDRGRKNAI